MRIVDHTERQLRQDLVDASRAAERMQVQLDQLIASNRDLSALLLTAERRRGELLKLVVSFRRLVEAANAAAAIRAVEEILITIIGTEDFVVFAAGNGTSVLPVAGAGRALDHARGMTTRLDQISGPSSRDAQRTAALWLGDNVVAAVPLQIGETVVGSIVIASLLPHRDALNAQDDQVLCLLGGFAATSIIASEERRRWTQLLPVAS